MRYFFCVLFVFPFVAGCYTIKQIDKDDLTTVETGVSTQLYPAITNAQKTPKTDSPNVITAKGTVDGNLQTLDGKIVVDKAEFVAERAVMLMFPKQAPQYF